MRPDTFTIGNAAGLAPRYEDVDRLCHNPIVTRVTTGPITLRARAGNWGQTYGFNAQLQASANSRGLPSVGLEKQMLVLPSMVRRCRLAEKELCASVVGFRTMEEWQLLIIGCHTAGIRRVELNFGCPNVWSDNVRKPIPSYEPDLARAILDYLRPTARNLTDMEIGVKISPVDDRTLSDLVDAITESGIVNEIVACNTIPDQDLLLEDGSHALAFTVGEDPEIKHLGGVAGEPLRSRSLRIHDLLQGWLPKPIRRVGCGGIFASDHVMEYLENGVAGFQCGTALVQEGLRIFGNIVEGLPDDVLQTLCA